jgi:hypothetical protein
MKDTMIGVDLAKRVFQLHGASMTGQVKFRKKLTLEQFRRFMSDHPTCVVPRWIPIGSWCAGPQNTKKSALVTARLAPMVANCTLAAAPLPSASKNSLPVSVS